jgi:hypothetical protein
MFAMFPRLKEREHTEAGVLSGGEQQMLTLCRTLMGDPDLIIIDEPTEGLAPKIVELVGQFLQKPQSQGGIGVVDRAKTHHCHEHFGPRLGHGPWGHRVPGHTRRAAGQHLHSQRMAGSLILTLPRLWGDKNLPFRGFLCLQCLKTNGRSFLIFHAKEVQHDS